MRPCIQPYLYLQRHLPHLYLRRHLPHLNLRRHLRRKPDQCYLIGPHNSKSRDTKLYVSIITITLTSCWPKQVTGTGTAHGGQGIATTSTRVAGLPSHGPARGWVSLTLVMMAWWHRAGQTWVQPTSCLPHICLHGGHVPKWQWWGSRFSWWQSGGFLQNRTTKVMQVCGQSLLLMKNAKKIVKKQNNMNVKVLEYRFQNTAQSINSSKP